MSDSLKSAINERTEQYVSLVPFEPKPMAFSDDPAAIAAAKGAEAMIQAAFVMAYRNPRSEENARSKIVLACQRPSFAETVEYRITRGGKIISGPSTKLIQTALRLWQNVWCEAKVIYEDDYVRRLQIRSLDLETNTSFGKEITVKTTVERHKSEGREVLGERINSKGERIFIVRATDDEMRMKEGAEVSRVLRNEGGRLIPQDIIEDAIKEARRVTTDEDAKDPKAGMRRMIDAFTKIGVFPKDLEKYIGHPIEQSSPVEINELRGVFQAISDGDMTIKDLLDTESLRGEAKKERESKSVTKENLDDVEAKQSQTVKVAVSTSSTVTGEEKLMKEEVEKVSKKTEEQSSQQKTNRGRPRGVKNVSSEKPQESSKDKPEEVKQESVQTKVQEQVKTETKEEESKPVVREETAEKQEIVMVKKTNVTTIQNDFFNLSEDDMRIEGT